MSDLTDFAAAFQAVERRVKPSVEPTLATGDGVTPDPTAEFDRCIIKNKLASTFVISTAYTYGQIVMPITRNGHRYRVTVGGTTAATSPTWPAYAGGVVVSGEVTFEEVGLEFSNIYDIRGACYDAWVEKTAKAAGQNQYLRDGRAEGSDYTYLNCRREADRYRAVGVG